MPSVSRDHSKQRAVERRKRRRLHGPESRPPGYAKVRSELPILRDIIDYDRLARQQRAPARAAVAHRYAMETVEEFVLEPMLGGNFHMAGVPVDELDVAELLTGDEQRSFERRAQQEHLGSRGHPALFVFGGSDAAYCNRSRCAITQGSRTAFAFFLFSQRVLDFERQSIQML